MKQREDLSWRNYLDPNVLGRMPTFDLIVGLTNDEYIPSIFRELKDFMECEDKLSALKEVWDAFKAEIDRRMPPRIIDP